MLQQSITRIACLGEVMIELAATERDQARIGVAGDTYNTAVYLKGLLKDMAQVAYVTALGEDRFSGRIVAHMREHHIDTDCIEYRVDKTPGLYAIETDDTGERRFAYWRGQSAARTLFEQPCQHTLSVLERFDLVYLSGISLAILNPTVRDRLLDWIRAYRLRGGLLAFDSNYRPRLWSDQHTAQKICDAFWREADIALPSIDDEMALFQESQDQVLARFSWYQPRMGAIKQGELGPISLPDGQLTPGCLPAAKVVDTTAAGDSFNAGFLAAMIQGTPLIPALQAAHQLAAKVVQQSGAIITIDS